MNWRSMYCRFNPLTTMKKPITFLLFAAFAASLLAQVRTFAGTDYSQGIVFVMEDNRIVWQHPAPESNDLWVLPNGNLLFTTGRGVLEMTRQNDTIFHYASNSPIFACQRLKNGNTFIGECSTGRMLEVSPKGTIVRETCILPQGVTDAGSGFIRNARRLDNGHFLVAHYGDETVKEYDANGKVIWSLNVPGGPHSVTRLPNGHTMIAVADKNRNPRLIEVTKAGNVVWELSNADLPGKPLKFLGGFQYFSDGRILLSNWTGHENPADRVHLLLVDRQKNLLYSLQNPAGLQTMSSVFTTDKPQGVKSFH